MLLPAQTACPVPVVGGHHEVEQQPDGLLHIDLVGGGQPLVELVVDGRQDSLQPRHIDLRVVVQRVEPIVTKGFDHVPDIHQMNCGGAGKQTDCDQLSLYSCWNKRFYWLHSVVAVDKKKEIFKNLRALTVASLLHKPEFAGGPVRRQSDHVEVLSSCKIKA